ncbi:hypothetical protein MM326_18805 [Alkalihalobacillus sp. LMS6]|uniref:response regulator aspartate phosphatase n=1 Tax=Alkalihalobacillus sp. LMS6 TaxID=2924034 RepID=UPI0020D1D79A|nr:hypothetical protein [Alkalihalobacillus sp. LMS6]UTR06102.1 hypothetical protein MM326_18805 [Alkalihalobacillus sp. LMS6]
MEALAVERVGQQVVECYSCIIAKDVKQAKLLKPEVERMVAMMKPDDKMLAYYQLVSMLYDLLILKVSPDEANERMDLTILEGVATQANDYLHFMYYYVCGRNEFYHKRYKSAIRTYKIAERLLEKVEDPVEKAEFYQILGISYYHIDQFTFAFSYLEQALEFFEKHSSYKINVFACKQILSGIYSELHQHSKAQDMFNDLLEATKSSPYNHAVTTYNIGINRIWSENFEEAIVYFKKALLDPDFQRSSICLKAHYYIKNLELRLGTYIDGFEWVEEEAKKKSVKEIVGKLLVTRGLYLNRDENLVMEGLNLLESHEYFYDCYDMCTEVSHYYKRANDLKKASYYKTYARDMRYKSILGLDQA